MTVTAIAYAAAVVVRAAHGTATVGEVVLAVTLIQRVQLQVGQAAAAIGQLLADLIVVLDQGRIAATGNHASLVRAGGLYAELYEMQARAYR